MTLPDKISGRIWKLGDHVNTDILHPSSYFSLDEKRVREGLIEGMTRLGANFKTESPHEKLVIVAGQNFGCGSSRETSVRGLHNFGVKAIVAASFARIFFRSLTNLGVPAFECTEIQNQARNGELIDILTTEGFIELPKDRRFPFSPLDPHVKKILEAGGLIPYLQREREGEKDGI
ncbi:MAG TPA: 3-isopropylmalate dehydratase [Thermodesulfobacteriota bacterium]|nr:3-isopropylmalate dehydratase [Thermodesulfobacteriota bacterium]